MPAAPTPQRRMLAALIAAAALAWFTHAASPAAAAGDAAAAAALSGASLRALDGRPLPLRTREGQVVVVNFWASWCAPCRRELPRLDAMHRELSSRGVRVVAISVDHEAANAKRFQQRLRLSLPIAHDGPDGVARRMELPSLPHTLVLDGRGRVAYRTSESDARALAAIEAVTSRLLAEASADAGERGR